MGIGQKAFVAGGAEAVLEATVDLVLKLLGGHVFHLFEQLVDCGRGVGGLELLGGDWRARWIGEYIDADDVGFSELDRAAA